MIDDGFAWDTFLRDREKRVTTMVEISTTHARPGEAYHEDMGDVTWWRWEHGGWLGEPPYVGNPNDTDWPGYHTHFTACPPFPMTVAHWPDDNTAT